MPDYNHTYHEVQMTVLRYPLQDLKLFLRTRTGAHSLDDSKIVRPSMPHNLDRLAEPTDFQTFNDDVASDRGYLAPMVCGNGRSAMLVMVLGLPMPWPYYLAQ